MSVSLHRLANDQIIDTLFRDDHGLAQYGRKTDSARDKWWGEVELVYRSLEWWKEGRIQLE